MGVERCWISGCSAANNGSAIAIRRGGQPRLARNLLTHNLGPSEALVLEDISRLAYKHKRVAEHFRMFRERLGVPAPEGTPDE